MKTPLMILSALVLLTAVPAGAQTWNGILNSIRQAPAPATGCTSCAVSENGEAAPPPSISAADLCTSPATAICAQFQGSNVDAVQAALRKEVAETPEGDAFDLQFQKITAVKNALPTSGTDAQRRPAYLNLLAEEKKQMGLIGTLEKNILAKFNKTPADLSVFFEQVRTSLVNHVNTSPEFDRRSTRDHIIPTRQDVINQLKSVKLETAESIADEPTPATDMGVFIAIRKREGFYKTCGPDGLQANAFYDPSSNSLKICPGFLVETLNDSGGKIQSLAMVLGHELGHAIDSSSGLDIQNLQTMQSQNPRAKIDMTSFDCYSKFLKCVDQKYVGPNVEHFGNLTNVIQQLKNNGLPALEMELTRLQSINPPDMDQISRVKSSLVTGKATLSQYTSMKQNYVSNQQNPDNVIELQQKEMTADYNSVFALNDQLRSLPQSERAAVAAQSYRLFCGSPATDRIRDLKWGDVNDALHPPSQFRMEMTFRNPEMRRLLGCVPITTPRPWCDINTPVSAAAH